MELNPLAHQWLVQAALMEDIGRGDITSNAVIEADAQARLAIKARGELVACGLPLAAFVFYSVNDLLDVKYHAQEGQEVNAGASLMEISGNARAILSAERTALNFLMRMCGVATLTRQYVRALDGTKTMLLDTRKTMPGFRELDKYAVLMGGGKNHRLRLDDGILIKDNHIAVAGSIKEAVARAKFHAPATIRVEVECDSIEQVKEALEAGADMILLDNMTPQQLHEAVLLGQGKVLFEASGNMSLANIRLAAQAGVDYISVGRITHSAPAVDIGMDFILS